MSTIPEVTLSQLGGANRLAAMIGAHSFTQDENALTFKFKARAKDGINCIRITLQWDDCYRVEFVRLRGVDCWTKADIQGVYVDALKRRIEAETGLGLGL